MTALIVSAVVFAAGFFAGYWAGRNAEAQEFERIAQQSRDTSDFISRIIAKGKSR